MVELIARKPFTYARRALRAGDRFAAHDSDVRILLAIGHADHPEPEEPPVAEPEPGTSATLPELPDAPAESWTDRVRRVVPKPRPRTPIRRGKP